MAAPELPRDPFKSLILIVSPESTELVVKLLVPLVNTVGMFIEPSVLLVTLVIIYCDDATAIWYVVGVVLVVNQAASSVPLMVVVP